MSAGVSLSASQLNPSPSYELSSDRKLTREGQTVRPSKMAPNIDRTRIDPKVLEAADGMEAMFLDYLLKVMRQTVPKDGADPESPATEIYRSMLDSEVAQKASRTGGVGLSDQIIAYLQSRSYTGNQGAGPRMSPVAVSEIYSQNSTGSQTRASDQPVAEK